ncbi:MAG: ABC transporter permease subunit [Chloroflexi bacterium]|nr:ABC transporter permease subunit [Chloroflexota bacterium]
MSMRNVIRALGPIDARNIRRDSLLSWMAFMPFLLAALFRFVIPWGRDRFLTGFGFDIEPYYILLASYGFVMGVPAIFGMVIGFILLDERDDDTLTALQVTPMSLNNYLAYRIVLPMILSVLLILISYPLAEIGTLPLNELFIAALLAAPMAPLFALFLASVAKNKVQGFAIMKGSSAFLILPVAAYFFTSHWTLLLGLIPTYWPLKVYWMFDANNPGVWGYVIAGFVVQGLMLYGLLRRFNTIMHQ